MRAAVFLLLSCGGAAASDSGPKASAAAVNGAPVGATSAPASSQKAPPVAKRTGLLTVAEARRYMVELINHDRASEGRPGVVLDEGPPTIAGQRHAEDMAHLGYLGHWGSDGSVPEQRISDAGGADMDLENALCMTDTKERALDPSPMIDAQSVEDAESMFFNEPPPHDGHRQNILKPPHNRVGIGIAQPLRTPTELPTPCFSQEFIDAYGTYAPIPRRAKVGSMVHVEGTLASPAVPGGVGLARIDAPKPISPAGLNTAGRRMYALPVPYQNYWPKGFETPIPITVEGQSFKADLPLSDGGKPGLYEVIVWAKMPGDREYSRIGLRTVVVD